MAQLRDELSKTGGPLERRNVEQYQPQETAGRHNSLLQLQRRAGNRAVVDLFEGTSLSRPRHVFNALPTMVPHRHQKPLPLSPPLQVH